MTDDQSDYIQPEQKPVPIFNIPNVVLMIGALLVSIHIIRDYVLSVEAGNWVIFYGSIWPIRFTLPVTDPFWPLITSPITYSLLHGGWQHLILNGVWLLAFGSPLAVRMGWVRFIAFWIVTAIAGAAAHIFADPSSAVPMLGASGAISGMTAAAARFGFRATGTGRVRGFLGRPLTLIETFTHRTSLTFIIVWFAINFISGAGFLMVGDGTSGIAWQAHIGGFLAGLVVLPLFVSSKTRK